MGFGFGNPLARAAALALLAIGGIVLGKALCRKSDKLSKAVEDSSKKTRDQVTTDNSATTSQANLSDNQSATSKTSHPPLHVEVDCTLRPTNDYKAPKSPLATTPARLLTTSPDINQPTTLQTPPSFPSKQGHSEVVCTLKQVSDSKVSKSPPVSPPTPTPLLQTPSLFPNNDGLKTLRGLDPSLQDIRNDSTFKSFLRNMGFAATPLTPLAATAAASGETPVRELYDMFTQEDFPLPSPGSYLLPGADIPGLDVAALDFAAFSPLPDDLFLVKDTPTQPSPVTVGQPLADITATAANAYTEPMRATSTTSPEASKVPSTRAQDNLAGFFCGRYSEL